MTLLKFFMPVCRRDDGGREEHTRAQQSKAQHSTSSVAAAGRIASEQASKPSRFVKHLYGIVKTDAPNGASWEREGEAKSWYDSERVRRSINEGGD